MDEKYEQTGKWIKILMYCGAVGVANSLLNYLPFVPSDFTGYVSLGTMAVVVLCMFQLADANGRYKTVGILQLIGLGCLIANDLIYSNTVMQLMYDSFSMLIGIAAGLTLVASVLLLVANYLEYNAHSELVECYDTILAAKWRRLFFWGIAASAVISVGSAIMTVILTASDMAAGMVTISTWISVLLRIPELGVEVLYVLYLNNTADLFRKANIDEKEALV